MGWLENTYNKAKKAVKKTASNVSDFVGDAKDKVVDTADNAYNYVVDKGKGAYNYVASGEAWDDAKKVAGNAYDYVTSGEAWEDVKDSAEAAGNYVKDTYNYATSGEFVNDIKEIGENAKGAYTAFMGTDLGKNIVKAWDKLKEAYASPSETETGGVYSPFINTQTPNSGDTFIGPPTPPTPSLIPTPGAASPVGGVPTYEQWKAQGGSSAGAYTSYQNSIKSADEQLERQKNAAMTNYELARSNYGAEAEALRSAGLTGGYSDYLDSKAYALAQGNIASAERKAADTKYQAERDLYAKYDEIAAEEKAKTQQLEQIKIDSLGYSPDQLYALSKSVNGTISEDEYNTIVNDWITYNEKKGNTSAISEYGKLSGKDYSERESKANTVQGQNIDVSGADANSPTAIIDSLGSVAQSVKDTVIANVASKFVSDGKTKTYKHAGNFSGLNNFNKGQKFHFDFSAGTNMFGKDRIKTEYVDIDTTYEASSNMYKLLEQMANGANILVFNNALYVKGKAKNGETRWIKTDQKDVT